MVVDERSRHELYRRLEEVLGAEAATTLIEHLPPVGWADVATKHDLANLEERMDLRFARVGQRFDMVDQRFDMMDERFKTIDQRFGMIDERFKTIDRRFDMIDQRFVGLDQRLDQRFGDLDQRFVDLDTRFTAIVEGSAAQTRALFEHELRGQITTVMFGIMGVVMSMAALAFALVRFTPR